MGVYLKYVLVGGAVAAALARAGLPEWPLRAVLPDELAREVAWWDQPARWAALYASVSLFSLAGLFLLRKGDTIIGKSAGNGKIPLWSYLVFWPFHITNLIAIFSKRFFFRRHIPDATEVVPNFYIGGWFADWSDVKWHAIVDLTTEFPQRSSATAYLNVPTWDGNPPAVPNIDRAAHYIAKNAQHGPTLTHCASGIGRSACVLSAALVVAGHADDYLAALKIIQSKRPIVRLNAKMRAALDEWQALHRAANKVE